MNIPDDVLHLIRSIFADCNIRVAAKLSRTPNLHETSLDHSFIEHFTHHCRPILTPSEWTIRFDCHFIGGGRHYGRWEIADFGVLVIFRHKGRVLRSKVTLLQSKRLFPREASEVETNPLDEYLGFNFLFMSDERWTELTGPRQFAFEPQSLYRSLQIGDEQFDNIEKYERRHKIPVHYLLYNPLLIPSSMTFPITEREGPIGDCIVGCRVVPSSALRKMVRERSVERPPSYEEVSTRLCNPFTEGETIGGFRLESYVVDQLIACKDGLIDNTPKFEHLLHIFSQKSGPIHAAILITFDVPSASAIE